MTAIAGTNVAAGIVPFDTNDAYQTHDAKYGKGGYRSVADLTARDAITAQRLDTGMVVYVVAESTEYRWTGSTWDVVTTPSSGGGSALVDVTEALGLFVPKSQFNFGYLDPINVDDAWHFADSPTVVNTSSFDFSLGNPLSFAGSGSDQAVFDAATTNVWFNGPELPGYNFMSMQMRVIPSSIEPTVAQNLRATMQVLDLQGNGWVFYSEPIGEAQTRLVLSFLLQGSELVIARSDPFTRDLNDTTNPVPMGVWCAPNNLTFQANNVTLNYTFVADSERGVPHPGMRNVSHVGIYTTNGERIVYARVDGID
jgi:hypothetical protein